MSQFPVIRILASRLFLTLRILAFGLRCMSQRLQSQVPKHKSHALIDGWIDGNELMTARVNTLIDGCLDRNE